MNGSTVIDRTDTMVIAATVNIAIMTDTTIAAANLSRLPRGAGVLSNTGNLTDTAIAAPAKQKNMVVAPGLI